MIQTDRQPTQVAWQADWACDRKTELGKSFSHSCPFSVPLIDFCTSQVRLLNKGYCVLDGVLEDFESSGLCLQSASQSQSWLSNTLLPMHIKFCIYFTFQSHFCLWCSNCTQAFNQPLRDGSSVFDTESALSIFKQRWWYLYPVSCWCWYGIALLHSSQLIICSIHPRKRLLDQWESRTTNLLVISLVFLCPFLWWEISTPSSEEPGRYFGWCLLQVVLS